MTDFDDREDIERAHREYDDTHKKNAKKSAEFIDECHWERMKGPEGQDGLSYQFESGIGDLMVAFILSDDDKTFERRGASKGFGKYVLYVYDLDTAPDKWMGLKKSDSIEQLKKIAEQFAYESWLNIKEDGLDYSEQFLAEEGKKIGKKDWDETWSKIMDKHMSKRR